MATGPGPHTVRLSGSKNRQADGMNLRGGKNSAESGQHDGLELSRRSKDNGYAVAEIHGVGCNRLGACS